MFVVLEIDDKVEFVVLVLEGTSLFRSCIIVGISPVAGAAASSSTGTNNSINGTSNMPAAVSTPGTGSCMVGAPKLNASVGTDLPGSTTSVTTTTAPGLSVIS